MSDIVTPDILERMKESLRKGYELGDGHACFMPSRDIEAFIAEIERLQRADEQWREDYREARAEIERLRASLQIVREENDRAKRQFTNVSNKILDDACRALEPKP